MIKGILFDLDGVLVDAVTLHQNAFIKAIKPHKTISIKYHQKYLNGLPTRKKLEKLGFNKEKIEEINQRKQKITQQLIPKLIHPIAEVVSSINKIKEMGIPFAICSNCVHETVKLVLETIKLSGYSFFISNEDVIHPKPNPEMYNTAIKRLGLKPSQVLIVEDTQIGLEAAKASGAHYFRIANPYEISKVLEELCRLK